MLFFVSSISLFWRAKCRCEMSVKAYTTIPIVIKGRNNLALQN